MHVVSRLASFNAIKMLHTLALVSATSYFNGSNTAPADIREGDLLVLYEYVATGGAATIPSGFTTIHSNAISGGTRATSSYKIADGTEGGSTLSTTTSGGQNDKILYVFRGNVPIRQVVAVHSGHQDANGNPAAVVVASGSGRVPMVVIGGFGSTGAPNSRTMSPTEDGSAGGTNAGQSLYKIYNFANTPADVTVDMGDNGNQNSVDGYYLACA